MVEKKYYANELTCFAKFVADKSRCGRYLLIGYYNKDKTKFKHIASGNVYSVHGAKAELDRPGYPGCDTNLDENRYEVPAIEDMGQAFIEVEPTIVGVSAEFKSRFMVFSKPCVFSKVYPEAFREYNGRVGFSHLYNFIEKNQSRAGLVVTGIDLFLAEREANMYAVSWLYNSDIKEDSSDEPFLREREVSPTEVERDF